MGDGDPDWEDGARLASLVKEHGLKMRQQGGLWYFDDLGWRAASQGEALAFAEGYDRCMAQRWPAKLRRMLSRHRA